MCGAGGGGGGGGSGTQKIVYQKWPDQISPILNFVFSHYGHFGLDGGGQGDYHCQKKNLIQACVEGSTPDSCIAAKHACCNP